jgi:hypothetical protein
MQVYLEVPTGEKLAQSLHSKVPFFNNRFYLFLRNWFLLYICRSYSGASAHSSFLAYFVSRFCRSHVPYVYSMLLPLF